MLAIPTTIVRNTIGATTILIRLMNPSITGLSALPHSGRNAPMLAPIAIATST